MKTQPRPAPDARPPLPRPVRGPAANDAARVARPAVRARSRAVLTAAALDAHRFSAQQLDRLFAAVLIDDEVDAHTELPETIELDYGERQLTDCFRICRQLWQAGVDRDELIELTHRLWRERDLTPEERLRFKHARAKFKHLRFAFALYDSSHRYPPVLDWMTTALGHLQDAFKTRRRAAVAREAALCRMFLAAGPGALLQREVDRLSPCGGGDFRRYVLGQVGQLRAVLAQDMVTGAQFHATRKIVSRQVSFYDSLRTIEPTRHAFLMSRSFSAINGLMGEMHDTLVERRVAGTQDYHATPFALPGEIKQRLDALVARYPER